MGDVPGRRMRSMSVAIGVTAVAAAALSGCSSTPDYNAVCMDDRTQQRVSDDQCDNNSGTYGSYYRWYYLPRGTRLPSMGSRVSGGSTTEPAGSVNRGGRVSSGGSYGDSGGSGGSAHDYGGFGGHSGGVGS